MERKSVSYAGEPGRLNPVRRLIDRFAGAESSVAASLARDRWHGEHAPSRGRSANRAAWFEQVEFWPEPEKARDEKIYAQPVEVESDPVVAPPAEWRGGEESDTEPRPRARVVRKLDIMKLLQVNDGVYGACREPVRFALPRRGFAARLQLWKGAPVGTHFLTGC